jgi:hypothetical protein
MAADKVSRHPRGNQPPAETTVDFKIGVGGEKEWIGQDFREPDQAHRDIGVFVQEIEDRDEGILVEW